MARASTRRWQQALASWAIPEHILAQAPEDPWALPVALFEPGQSGLTPSHHRALEALASGGQVLDVGAGRCAMSLPLRPPADRIVAVDSQPAMLENSPADITVVGSWPEAAAEAGPADVVVCGHVLYNVADLAPFIEALQHAARRRVVIEITRSHPRNRPLERALWKHFWDLERPTGPSWEDARSIVRGSGIEPHVELWESEQRGGFTGLDDLVAWMRQTVCLDSSRDDEVRSIVLEHAVERDGRWRLSVEPRELVTLWWDIP
ncbi:MAG: class I SAM-dependent methyltransferase [Chloroflexi bacterium]|nr:MAG: class I SAM-dependent methyltransferase [Chloroflexota bacterium]